jgi:hypothetical protein
VLAPRTRFRDTADMTDTPADTIIEYFEADTCGFESHRRLHEYKSRPEIAHIVFVDTDTRQAIVYSRGNSGWHEELRDVDGGDRQNFAAIPLTR